MTFEVGFEILFLYLVVLNFFLAFFILFRNPKLGLNRSFSLLCFALSIWIFSLFASRTFSSGQLLWVKIGFFTQLIIVIDTWYLSFIYPQKEKTLTSAALIFGTAYFIAFSILLFFSPFWMDKQFNYGNGFLLYTTISWIPIAWTILNFNSKLNRSIGLEKVQLRYIFWAYVFWAFSAHFLANIFNLGGNYVAQLAFAALASLVLTVAIFYAIARYRLLDIRFLVSKAIVYSFLLIIVVIFYTYVLYIVGLYFYQAQMSTVDLAISLSLTILVVMTAFPIRAALEKITRRSLLKDKLIKNQALSDFSQLFFESASIASLANVFCLKLRKVLGLEEAYFMFHQNGQWTVFPEKNEIQTVLAGLARMVDGQTAKLYVFDELKEGATKELMRQSKIYYIYPYNRKDKHLSGFFMLGYKQSGEIYFDDERNFLNIIFTQFFNTLERVMTYDDLRHFNRTLTDRVNKATQNLRQTNRNLTKALQLKDEVLSIVSHELVVPMVATTGSLSTILEGYTGRLTPKSRDFIQAIYNENLRLIRLTQNLLNIGRIRSERINYVIEVFNPAGLVREVVGFIEPLVKEKKLRIKIDMSDINFWIKADRDKLKEIYINLIDNAIRNSQKGQITVGFKPEGKQVKFFVKDNGRGISPSEQRSLFAELDLLDNQKIMIKKGRGLGLYICHHLLAGMQGKMDFISVPGKQTEFMFWLPKA